MIIFVTQLSLSRFQAEAISFPNTSLVSQRPLNSLFGINTLCHWVSFWTPHHSMHLSVNPPFSFLRASLDNLKWFYKREKKDTKDHSWHKYGFLTHQKRLSWNICWCGSVGKEFACNVGDPDSIPGQGRSLREGNSYPLQYSCLENFMDRGAWQLQSKRSQGVRHDWVTNTFTFPFWIHLKFQLLK